MLVRKCPHRNCKVDSYTPFFKELGKDDDEASKDSGANESPVNKDELDFADEDDEGSEDSSANEPPVNKDDLEFVEDDESGESEKDYFPCDRTSDDDSASDDSTSDGSDSYDISDSLSNEYGVFEVPSPTKKIEFDQRTQRHLPILHDQQARPNLNRRCTSGA
jgi:hypothetical protein